MGCWQCCRAKATKKAVRVEFVETRMTADVNQARLSNQSGFFMVALTAMTTLLSKKARGGRLATLKRSAISRPRS